MAENDVNFWLINTGWSGGEYGSGSRIKLKYTRAMISAALSGELDFVDYTKHEVFDLNMPNECPNVPTDLLFPRNTWIDKNAYDRKANKLATAFYENFTQYADDASPEILAAVPKQCIKIN